MKLLILLLFPILINAQSIRPVDVLQKTPCDSSKSYTGTYVGTIITPDYIGVSITSEVQLYFILLSLQTNLNNYDPTFKGRLGFIAGKKEDKLKFIVFAPMFNFSLDEWKYNTPLSVSLRYSPVILNTNFLVECGTEFYKDKLNPFLTISIPFK